MKLAIDSGCNFFNSGEFYGTSQDPTANLKLLARFFEAGPEYMDRMFISVKGAYSRQHGPDCSPENLRQSVENINSVLKFRKMDLFEPARVDKRYPIEEVIKNLANLRDEGHFKYIGLSEVSAETIRKAHAVAPIAAVEVEYSPFTLDIEKNGVLAVCKELDIPIIAYSPLSRGILAGTIKSPNELPANDRRLVFDRFQPEHFFKNMVLVDQVKAIADKHGVTPVQLILAWSVSQWEKIIPIPGSTRCEGVKEAASVMKIILNRDTLLEVRKVFDEDELLSAEEDTTKGRRCF